MELTSHSHHSDTIEVAFEPHILESLIRAGKLHASDFNCLNQHSKQNVWSMLRSAAVSKLQSR